ncbi:transmembrane protein 71 [Nycticebus coucang]|uniref:transmembrane protein 71 n=1 Tax=Nycticebus coucang TaxID=9470 RepID=UPI00234C4306|nr:transmembrane protein 71 [Nycticebus coucang]
MYRISQLMSTPAASKCSSRLERECAGELSATCIFPRTCDSLETGSKFIFSCYFPDGDSSFERCSMESLTGFRCICRRSPRLLTNGYYIWTEDSFLWDDDGNVTLNPSQTRVIYKENLVRIFRKKKKIRHSLPSLFNLHASKYWLHGSFLGDVNSSPSEDVWLEEVRRLDTDHCNGNGGDLDCSSPTHDWDAEMPSAEDTVTSSSGHIVPQLPREGSQDSPLQSQLMASEHFQENICYYSKTSLSQEVSFQAILFAMCLISFACARWFMEGILASVFTCSLLVMVASLPAMSKPQPVLDLPKFDNHLAMPLMNVFQLDIQKLSGFQSP